MAGVTPIGIEIKIQMYNRLHGREDFGIEYDILLPLNEWPHPAKQVAIIEAKENKVYPLEIYTD
jgi:hypothetical protein